MLEADLVASFPAVAHLLSQNDERALYKNSTRSNVYEILLRNAREISVALRNEWRSDPDDETARIRDFIFKLPEELGLDGKSLWREVRKLISNCLNKSWNYGPQSLYADAVARSVDELFFALGERVPHGETQIDSMTKLGDSHVHLGGAVPWNAQWCLIMTGQYPVWAYSRAPNKLLKKRRFYQLLVKAIKIRKKLAQKYSLETWLRDPSFENFLYRRLGLLGESALDDCNVRNYVIIRSIARREMLIGEVESLNEFTGSAWKRFYGQRTGKQILGSKYWEARLSRMHRQVTSVQVEAAVKNLSKCSVTRAALRANADWPPVQLGQQMRYARHVISSTPFLLIFHARRPHEEDIKDFFLLIAILLRSILCFESGRPKLRELNDLTTKTV
jgi:hypothetical protein